MGLRSLTQELTEAVVNRFANPPFTTLVVTELTATSWGGLRFDVVAHTPNKRHLVIIEVKTSRSDFIRGRPKFEKYMAYCHQFYVAAPVGLVKKKDLPPGAGLLEYYASGVLRLQHRAQVRDMDSTYLQVIERLVQKIIVEGSTWSQKKTWEATLTHWRFREWLRTWEERHRQRHYRKEQA